MSVSSHMLFHIGWVEEILHHQKDGWNSINHGIKHRFQLVQDFATIHRMLLIHASFGLHFLRNPGLWRPGRTRKLTNVSCRFSSSRPRGSRKRTVRTPISSPERGENPSKNRGFTGATLIIVIFHNLGINQQKILDETLDLCIKYVYIKGVL